MFLEPTPSPSESERNWRNRKGVVAVIVRENRFLAIRRSATVTAPHKVCFPGGGIEPGETPREALLREMQEELGVEVIAREQLWTSTTPWGTHLVWWDTHLPDSQAIKPNPAEVADIFWLTAEELAQRHDVLASVPQFLNAFRNGEFRVS